jgi:1-deoxy-D-xylulose-5-phosphate reductoisomerase
VLSSKSVTRLTLLGSTGSIGTSTLDIVRRRREEFSVYALAAGENSGLLASQIAEFEPEVAVVASRDALERLHRVLGERGIRAPELSADPADLVRIAAAPETGFVLSAIVGVAGMEATYEAARAGKRIGLANKETLVAGGRLVMGAARESGAEIIPVDSEHNGAHQCLRSGRRNEVARLILTASGGPFRSTPAELLAGVTAAEALHHPTWKMGRRITIDSATLMNKGFEVIEACWLFDFAPEEVEVVVHPQSTVHAMVEFSDGSVVAQISATDMRMPIQYAMTYPARLDAPVPRLDWSAARSWTFEPPDLSRFPLLGAAYAAQRAGGAAACVLNAADEVAVEAFLAGGISFPGLAAVVQDTLEKMPPREPRTIQEVLEADGEARRTARELVATGRYAQTRALARA